MSHPQTKNIYYPPGGILVWIIIFLELITFGMALTAFTFSKKNEPEIFYQSRLQLNTILGTINTFLLISSGFFMAKAVHQYKEHHPGRFNLFMNLTMLGGLFFILLKCVEYYLKIKNNLLIDTNAFFTFYWLITLFHLIHVLVGLVILVIIKYKFKKQNPAANIENLEAAAAFWHMCDLIWLMIFPVLYLFN